MRRPGGGCYGLAVSATRPTTGGRFVARRRPSSEGYVHYEVELLTPEREWQGQARLAKASGEVTLELRCREETEEGAPAWLKAHVVAALRSAWRGLSAPSEATLEDFPRRITRWRAPLPEQEPTPP